MSSRFLYRRVLERLTREVVHQGLDPYEAYVWFCGRTTSFKRTVYASTSITSGGHTRDGSLSMEQKIARNKRSAMLLAEQLAYDRAIDSEGTIEPVFLGKAPDWRQSEYIEFWLLIIAGVELPVSDPVVAARMLRRRVQRAFDIAGIDFARLNDFSLAAEDRAIEYFGLSSALARLLRRGDMHYRPVGSLVRLIDPDLSLGAQTERVFARELDIPVMNVCTVRSVDPSEMRSVNAVLAQDMSELISFGSAVFDARQKEVKLSLVNEAIL